MGEMGYCQKHSPTVWSEDAAINNVNTGVNNDKNTWR